VNPAYVYVPYYNPVVVFARPRPGFYVGGAITFGRGVFVGGLFAPFGWGGAGFGWREHNILIDRQPWTRNLENRERYVHPYAAPVRRPAGPRVERHEVHGREHAEQERGDRR
jgi:hypothetical protein